MLALLDGLQAKKEGNQIYYSLPPLIIIFPPYG